MIIYVDEKQLKELSGKLDKFGKKITMGNIVLMIATEAKNKIFYNTNRGRDQDGDAFDAYNPRYARKESKSLVNLMLTGNMLNSMTQKMLSNNRAKIFFNNPSAQELADIHQNRGAGRSRVIRRFFGIPDSDYNELVMTYEKEVNKIQRGLDL